MKWTVCTAGLLLAAPAFAQDDTADATTEEEESTAAFEEENRTFGTALDLLGLQTSWSGYGDTVVSYTPGGAFSFDAIHFNPILGARLSDKTWAEIEIEFEHGGSETKLEYALIDHTISTALTLRIGKLLIPIGEFNDIMHPSFRWTQAARPGMFANVQPAVWADVGVEAFGTINLSQYSNLQYAAYVVNGLGGGLDMTGSKPIRALRGNVIDNNTDKGFGGRARFQFGKGAWVGDTVLSLSGYSGAVDDDNNSRWTVGNLTLIEKLGPLTINAEAATSFLGDRGGVNGAATGIFTPFETGLFVYPSIKTGKFILGARYDYVRQGYRLQTDADGVLVLDANGDPAHTAAVTTHTVVPSVHYAVSTFWNLRAQLDIPTDDPSHPTAVAMSAFYF